MVINQWYEPQSKFWKQNFAASYRELYHCLLVRRSPEISGRRRIKKFEDQKIWQLASELIKDVFDIITLALGTDFKLRTRKMKPGNFCPFSRAYADYFALSSQLFEQVGL